MTIQIGCEIWKVNYKSKSASKKVIELYENILKNEFSDSDYWGEEEQNLKLLNFSLADWKELIIDVQNWTDQQIQILFNILTNCIEFKEKSPLSNQEFISNKSEFYIYLLTICNDEIFINLIDDIDLIKLNANPNLENLEKIKARVLNLKSKMTNNKHGNTYTNSDYERIIKTIHEVITLNNLKSNLLKDFFITRHSS